MKIIYWFFLISILYGSETKMGFKVFRLYDETRNRLIEMDVWYPTDSEKEVMIPKIDLWRSYPEVRDASIKDKNKKYPLIVMSHGTGGERRDRTWLVNRLVSHDYIVASIDHFGDHCTCYHPDLFLSAWNRPLDVTFTLNYLLEESCFSNQIDPNGIGFTSYSFGGMAGIWLAGGIAADFEYSLKAYQFVYREFPSDVVENLEYEKSRVSYFDPRIKAYFLMVPPSWGFNYESLKPVDKPFFIVGAEKDDLLPPSSHACYLAAAIKNSECHILNSQANHYVFLNESTDLAKQVIDRKFFSDDPTVDRIKVHNKVGEMAVHFFETHLKEIDN